MATSNIAYQINYSNQGRTGYAGSVDNFFTIAPLKTNIDQPVLRDAANNQIAPTALSLVFTGYRNPEYGQVLWTNMLQLLENFASPTKPLNPVLGQLWFNKSSELGALQVCTNPTDSIWMDVNSRIFVGSTPPTVNGPTLWYNPDNRGLFFWDVTLPTTSTTVVSPYTTIDPTGPIDNVGHPTLHSQVGLVVGSKWVNVLYHRYAAVAEYNSLATQFAAWNMVGRPPALPTTRQPTDGEWLALFAYVKQFGDSLTPAVDTSSLVPTTFKYYSTDRFGFQLLRQHYDALVGVCTAIFARLAINQTPVPIVSFSTSSTLGIVPMVVNFTDSSVHTAGAAYLWNFGDGATSTQTGSVSHTYQSPGVYTASLSVTAVSGVSTASYVIQAIAIPVASFTRTPVSGTAPLTVTFTDTSANSPTSWLWNFGDGTTSTLQNPTHTYATVGTPVATLTATNAAGSHSTSQSITVGTPVVVSSFTVSLSTTPVSTSVAFTDTSANSPTSWLWNFGDGTTSTLQNPTHAYTTVGTYTATLTATNSTGSHSSSRAITVTAIAVVATFTSTPVSGTAPLTVAFTDTSTGTPTSWQWDFGDGTSVTSQNTAHVYSTPGNYTVTLTATNAAGSSVSTPTTVSVTANVVTITINAAVSNFNVYNNRLASQHGSAVTVSGTYVAGSVVNVNVNSGVLVGSTSIATPSFATGSTWHPSDTLTLTNNGMIVGKGGDANGGAGGLALQTQHSIQITNTGTIGGGGGGGGMGAYLYGTAFAGKALATGYVGGGGGGGGAGFAAGVGGAVNGGNSGSVGNSGGRPGSPYGDNASPGTSGTVTTGGVVVSPTAGYGGVCYVGSYANAYVLYGGNGGNGGALGAAGSSGTAGSQGGSLSTVSVVGAATPGGAPGAATSGNTYITWITTGTRLGTLG